MRAGFIADLHIDKTSQLEDDILKALSRLTQEESLSVLYIGGDISNDWQRTLNFIETLEDKIGIPVYFVPGNHDLWNKTGTQMNTWEIYHRLKEHPRNLIGWTHQLSDHSYLVGHIGWYNHAYFNKDRFSRDQIQRGVFKGVTWQDKRFIQWDQSDPQVSQLFAQDVANQLGALPEDSQIILLSHMVTHKAFTVPMPHRIFDYFNAYIATDDWEDYYKDYLISHSIQGHVHIRHQHQVGKTRLIGNSLGYPREWWTSDLLKEIKDALYILDF